MKKLLLLFLIVSQVIVSYSQEARIMQKKTSKNEIRIDLYSAYMKFVLIFIQPIKIRLQYFKLANLQKILNLFH